MRSNRPSGYGYKRHALAREHAAQDATEKQRWRDAQYRVDDDVRAVDPHDYVNLKWPGASS